ncbi:MAG: TonB family protein [bacterium]
MRLLGGAAGFPLAVGFSLSLHLLLVVLLTTNWVVDESERRIIKPKYVQATLIQIEAKQPPKPQPTKKPDTSAAEKERKAREQREEKARQEKLRQEKLRQEKLKQEKLRKEKEAAEKKRLEEAARKREAERKRQEELARERALQEALRAEEEQRLAETEQELVGAYSAYIANQIAQNWSRPPSARRGMECELLLQLAPNGSVISVAIAKSSGNDAFDRAAEQAVRKVDRFDRLREMDPAVFERNFRRLRLLFSPDDLRL